VRGDFEKGSVQRRRPEAGQPFVVRDDATAAPGGGPAFRCTGRCSRNPAGNWKNFRNRSSDFLDFIAKSGMGRTTPQWVFEQETMTNVAEFLREESGATAIEYGLIAAGISVAILGVVNALGSGLNATFNTIISDLASAGK
jgi:pilus assembly protein Flp/PilA